MGNVTDLNYRGAMSDDDNVTDLNYRSAMNV